MCILTVGINWIWLTFGVSLMWTFEELTFLAFVLFQLQGLTLKLQSLKIKKNLLKKDMKYKCIRRSCVLYIFIMCYVHHLQYSTATIQGYATHSGLHSFRVRPQRLGTVVMRHNSKYSIHLWLHWNNKSMNTDNANFSPQEVLTKKKKKTDGREKKIHVFFIFELCFRLIQQHSPEFSQNDFPTWDVPVHMEIICAYTKGITIARVNSNSFSNWHHFSRPINLR